MFPYFGVILYVCGCNSFCSVNTYDYLYLNTVEVSLTCSQQDFIWGTFSWLSLACVALCQEHSTAIALALPVTGDSPCYYLICPWCWASPKMPEPQTSAARDLDGKINKFLTAIGSQNNCASCMLGMHRYTARSVYSWLRRLKIFFSQFCFILIIKHCLCHTTLCQEKKSQHHGSKTCGPGRDQKKLYSPVASKGWGVTVTTIS